MSNPTRPVWRFSFFSGCIRWIRCTLLKNLPWRRIPAARGLPVLIEVNLGGETSKAGIKPDEVLNLAERIALLPALDLRGLMAIPPYLENAKDVRPYFRQLRALAADIGSRNFPMFP